MALTNTGLVKFVKTKLGVNYVYGSKGEILTKTKYDTLKRLYPNNVRATDVKKVGTYCTDCSGLISWYTKKIKSSQTFHDEAASVHPIKSIADAPVGAAVWRKGHIGVYIGDGRVIEARGAAYGVVETRVTARDFTHWFLIKDVSYRDEYYPKYTGTSDSIVTALISLGVDSSMEHRKRIAAKNAIEDYKGTAPQNIKMLSLLKKGKLKKQA